ncbi:MAG: ATP-binding protein [Planctomycetes bacterium]|nr:ATP-binding protein [Planctomycetota bacterium]
MIPRNAANSLRRLLSSYPIVTLTGPRQAGKTTLSRAVAAHLPYVNLERPDERDFAERDPRGFLRRFRDGAVFDEVQRVPQLLSYLQVLVDERRQNGMFVLTGSRQLLLDERVSQSLAGRTGLLTLLPLTLGELGTAGTVLDADQQLLHGFYPRVFDQRLDPAQAYGDYLATYVERDVRMLTEIRDRSAFRRFVRLCAGRTAQVLNVSALARDAGVSHQTARNWLSVLEASYVVFLLEPWFANVSARLTKAPKLYFCDVGLATHLLGIEAASQIATHPLRGALFETMVVGEALKLRTNAGRGSNLNFYRDSTGLEVDLLVTHGHGAAAVEIKSSATAHDDQLTALRRLESIVPGQLIGKVLVYDGDEEYERAGVSYVTPRGLAARLLELGGGP